MFNPYDGKEMDYFILSHETIRIALLSSSIVLILHYHNAEMHDGQI